MPPVNDQHGTKKETQSLARGGRLDAIDAARERLNTSVDIDWELWREDIAAGSIAAHAEGLARAGVLTARRGARDRHRATANQG